MSGEEGGAWIYGPEAAARFIARASWPWEREENRDGWAPKMLDDADMAENEIERAWCNLSAAAHCIRVHLPDLDPIEASEGGAP